MMSFSNLFICDIHCRQKLCLYIYNVDKIPSPKNVTLDTGGRTLHWNPILRPSDLPPDFELVHNYNITYLVLIYDKDDVDTVISVNSSMDRNYLNLRDESIEIDSCKEKEFVVQAVVNKNLHSENSSIVSGIFYDGEYCAGEFKVIYIPTNHVY